MKLIIHQGHSSLENSKKCARKILFWPLINSEIEDVIKDCPTCLIFCNRKRSESAIKHPVRQEPLTKFVANLCWLNGHYLIIGSRL